MKKFIEQTEKPFATFKHKGKYLKDRTTWRAETKIVILKAATKNEKGETIDWCFATNQRAHLGLVKTYMKRWNIETGFRIHDEARIKTKSSHPLIRYFYHLLGMVFILIWRMKRRKKPKMSFKRLLKLMEMSFVEEEKAPPWYSWIKS